MICLYEKYDAVVQDDLKIDILVTKKKCLKVNLGDQYPVALILILTSLVSGWLVVTIFQVGSGWLLGAIS